MQTTTQRRLLVIADDFGIGANTTNGILQLAARGHVTGSALIVNTHEAPDAIRKWRKAGSPLELGWHPNLTLDTPIAPAGQIPTLVRPDGTFWPLKQFLPRWFFGLLDPCDIRIEWQCQLDRFAALVGHPPTFVNCHQHVGVFAPIGMILLELLSKLKVRPYVRRVQEPWPIVCQLPGARLKRVLLGWLGRRLSRIQEAHGFPGNDWLAGITNPACMESPDGFVRWLHAMPGQTVELMCHPGRLDTTLVGRDCTETDGLLRQRVNEFRLLRDPSFIDAVAEAGFRLTSPSELLFSEKVRALCA